MVVVVGLLLLGVPLVPLMESEGRGVEGPAWADELDMVRAEVGTGGDRER